MPAVLEPARSRLEVRELPHQMVPPQQRRGGDYQRADTLSEARLAPRTGVSTPSAASREPRRVKAQTAAVLAAEVKRGAAMKDMLGTDLWKVHEALKTVIDDWIEEEVIREVHR